MRTLTLGTSTKEVPNAGTLIPIRTSPTGILIFGIHGGASDVISQRFKLRLRTHSKDQYENYLVQCLKFKQSVGVVQPQAKRLETGWMLFRINSEVTKALNRRYSLQGKLKREVE